MGRTFRWIGVTPGSTGADFALASDWIDVATGKNGAPTAADTTLFNSNNGGTADIVSLLASRAVGGLAITQGADVVMIGNADAAGAVPPGTAQTLAVPRVALGGAGTSGSLSLQNGTFLSVADAISMTAGSLLAVSPFNQGSGVTVADSGVTAFDQVAIGSGGSLTGAGRIIGELIDNGLVAVQGGTLFLGFNVATGGGYTGTGTIRVAHSGVLDVSGNVGYHNTPPGSIGTLDLAGALNLGATDLVVTGDYINRNAGVGNAYDPLAGVTANHTITGPNGPIEGYIDSNARLAVGGDVTLTGTAADGSSAYTLDFRTLRSGETIARAYSLLNIAPPGGASLRGAIQTTVDGAGGISGELSGNGIRPQNYGPIAAGTGSASYDLTLAARSSGVALLGTLHIATDFANAPAADVTMTGTVYAPAVVTMSASALDFGIVHVGDANVSDNLTVTNAATGTLADLLQGASAIAAGPFGGGGTLGAGLAAGASTMLTYTLNTAQAGSFAASSSLAFTSHDSVLPDLGLGNDVIGLSAQVNNYAAPAFAVFDQTDAQQFTTPGRNPTVDLGALVAGSVPQLLDVFVDNSAIGPADLLSGTFSQSGDVTFTVANATPFNGVAAGSSVEFAVTAGTSQLGTHTETITLHPTGSNASGYTAALPDLVLTVTDTITLPAAINAADYSLSGGFTPPDQQAALVDTTPLLLDGTEFARIENIGDWNAIGRLDFILPTDGIAKYGLSYLFANFVDTSADLTAAGDSGVTADVIGAKAGELDLGSGGNTVLWSFESNGGGTADNTATINVPGLASTVVVTAVGVNPIAAQLLASHPDPANNSDFYDPTYDGHLSTAVVNLGYGLDTVEAQGRVNLVVNGGDSAETLVGAGGTNVFNTGQGVDTMTGGTGNTTFIEHAGKYEPLVGDLITDFHAGDLIAFQGFNAGATLAALGSNVYQASDGTNTLDLKVDGVPHLTAGTDYVFN